MDSLLPCIIGYWFDWMAIMTAALANIQCSVFVYIFSPIGAMRFDFSGKANFVYFLHRLSLT
jgi:hypothetical protein